MEESQKKNTESTGIGKRICKSREDKGLQQKDLALLLGYKSRTSVSKLENEETIPTIDIALRLSEILEVDLFWLITGKQNTRQDIWNYRPN